MSASAQITESVTSPSSTLPVVTLVGAANWLSSLPEIINILTAVYLVLLVSHKLYVFYREWKTKTLIKD